LTTRCPLPQAERETEAIIDSSLVDHTTSTPEAARLAGAPVIARIRRVLITALIAGVAYSAVTTGSTGRCAGPTTSTTAGDGSVSVHQACIAMQLHPSPVVVVALAVILIVAISRVLKPGVREADALRTLDRAATTIAIVAAASILVSVAWFALIPIGDWQPGSGFGVLFPFPLAEAQLTITP
jgi:hypothetical protein